uniref:Phospholipase-like, aminotransferase-like mobile domain protein n=1 Tax=Tanacetum cinerariifolium TaxID=118510 RepID=A0A6L2NV84_TANCI|nr:phospholipase-like, aminotransferase-like mobile domain protein [Tanacetum cinerariifolium]
MSKTWKAWGVFGQGYGRLGDISFRDRVFLEKIGEYVKRIDLISVIEDEEHFTGWLIILKLGMFSLERSREAVSGRNIFHFKIRSILANFFPRAKAQSKWFTKSNNFFKWYTPRAPPVENGGLFGDYLKKLSSARTLSKKDRESWSEIKSLKARIYKLKTIINVITPKTKATNVKQKDKVESVGKQSDLDDKCWSDQDGNFLHDDCVKAEKQEAEQRRLRLQLMLEEENRMKSIDRSISTHMKLALEKCGTTNRRRLVCFLAKGIDPTHYNIKFRHAQNVPKQGRVFGDCSVFIYLFLHRLAHGIPLDVEDPIQTDAKLIRIKDQLLVLIKRQVETELMLEVKFRDLCEEMSNFVKESEDVRDLYKMTRLRMMVDESHLSASEKHTFVSKMNLVRILILTTTTSGGPNQKLKPGTQDRGCGYFMWKDDLIRHLSFSFGPSTPLISSLGPSTHPSYSPLRSTLNLKKVECSNCNFLAEKIKALEMKIKIQEGILEMERHLENQTHESAVILHELYNDIGKLGLDKFFLYQ